MPRDKRNGGVQNFEDASGLDVVISRRVDTSVTRQLKKSLEIIEDSTCSAIKPFKIGHIGLRILGSESIKNSLGTRKGRKFYIKNEDLQDIEDYINEGNAGELMSLNVQDIDEPFYVDSENDQLIAGLNDTNREYTNNRIYIARKIQQYLGLRNLTKSEISELTLPSNPDLALAGISRNMVNSHQVQEVLQDPNFFIVDSMYDNEIMSSVPSNKELIPETIVFGGFKVALQQRRPDHFVITDQADSLGKHRFNKDGKLVRTYQEIEYA